MHTSTYIHTCTHTCTYTTHKYEYTYSTHTYTCTYTNTHTCTHIQVYIHIYTYANAYLHTCIYTCTHITHKYIHPHICTIHTHRYPHIHICIHTCICTHIQYATHKYTHMNTFTDAYIRTYTHPKVLMVESAISPWQIKCEMWRNEVKDDFEILWRHKGSVDMEKDHEGRKTKAGEFGSTHFGFVNEYLHLGIMKWVNRFGGRWLIRYVGVLIFEGLPVSSQEH